MSKVKVLFFAADPLSASPDGRKPRLLLDEDVRQTREKVQAAAHRDAIDFDFRLAARADDLIQALNETRPQVVHFSGHGDHDGLVLASTDGKRAHLVDAATLARVFRAFRGDIRVVVLNACLSMPQAEALAEVVGCAIGTRAPISDEGAITFGASFYRALAFGHSVQAAYDQACAALALNHFDEREHPELVARADVDPARLVLVPTDGAAPPRPAPARTRRWAGTVAAAAALAAGIALWNPMGDGDRPEVLGLAGGLSDASSSRAGAATSSAAPGDGSPEAAELAAARDLYEAGNFAAALPLFQRAAEGGDAEAMGFLGVMYLNGEGTRPDPSLAVLWLRKAVDQKRDARAMNALGTAFERGAGEDQSDRWAAHWYRAAAEEKSYAPAMSNLARMYSQGRGVKASADTALDWYRRAAEAGSVDALVDAGAIHQEGLAGAPDPKEALRLYHAAAQKGSARGMVAIGRMYQEGDGVTQDHAAARSWYEKGAKAGSAEAMNNLGVLYQEGWGVEPDRAEAIRWFRRAAAKGSTVAAANLRALGAD